MHRIGMYYLRSEFLRLFTHWDEMAREQRERREAEEMFAGTHDSLMPRLAGAKLAMGPGEHPLREYHAPLEPVR